MNWSLGSMFKKTHTDAGIMGWQYRFLSGFGVGILLMTLWRAAGEKALADPMMFTVKAVLLGVVPIIFGEFMLHRRLDEFVREIEMRGLAAGGVAAGVASFFSCITCVTWLNLPNSGILVAMTSLASLYTVRIAVISHGMRRSC